MYQDGIRPLLPGVESPLPDHLVVPVSPTPEHLAARAAAVACLRVMAISRRGLITHLSGEYGPRVPFEIAVWAADHAGADWYLNAARCARAYLDTMPFTRAALYEQLTSERAEHFTPDEARAGLAAVGW